MLPEEKKQFTEIVKGLCTIFDKDYSHALAGMYWTVLEAYSLEDVAKASSIHCAESKFFPRPADLIGNMPDPMGWMGEEEAWGQAPKSEYDAGYVTDEIMQAWGVASDALNRGDQIGARMAFKEKYTALIREAKRDGRKPRYWYSGSSLSSPQERAELRLTHIQEAHDKKWIGSTQAQQALISAGASSGMPENIAQLVRKAQKRLTESGSSETES